MSHYRRMSGIAAVLTLAAAAAAGCDSSGDASAPAPDPDALVGNTYLSGEVTGPAIPGGGPLEISFPQRGRISATAGCNRQVGEVGFAGDVLTPGTLASTMMACPGDRGDSDAWLSDFLSAPLTWHTPSRTTLVLSRGEGPDRREVTLTQRQNEPLSGPTWIVTNLVTAQAVESSVELEAARPSLVFADGEVTGSTGCNRLSGAAVVTGAKIEFRNLAVTKMACGDERARIEKVVLDTLRGTASYTIDGDRLSLTNDADPSVGLRLRAE